jgi:sugar lactone lactonase YvrE
MATLSSIVGTGSSELVVTALTAAATVDISVDGTDIFTLTPDQNTTFTVSGVPAAPNVGKFNLALTGFAATNITYDIAGAVYDSISFVSSSNPVEVLFKPDGTRMYLLLANADTVYQYDLSTPWDVSTSTYNSVLFSVTSQDTTPLGLTFSADGTKMYMVGNTVDKVFQYTLSTAWDLSTATYASISQSVTAQGADPTSLHFKPDGTKMYILSVTDDTVFQYTLSTAWNVNTATYDSVSKSVTAQESNPLGLTFKPDGTGMYIVGTTNDTVYQYTLSTAWDLSTASYDTISFSVATQELSPYSLTFSADGTKMYVVGQNTDTVHQYTVGSVVSATTTYPASFKFPDGATPAAPLDGATDILKFQTTDGGTNWYGVQIGADFQ